MKSTFLLSTIAAGLFVAATGGTSFAQEKPATQPTTQPATQPAATQPQKHTEHKQADHKQADHKKDGEKKKDADKEKKESSTQAAIGQPAPAFKLTSAAGKEVSLGDYKGKIVVLEWFNPECPYIVKHHKTNTTFNDLHKKYAAKDVVFLAINSNREGKQGSGKERNAKAAEEFKLAYPILLDTTGETGKAYGAKTTPHCFVIDKKGVLAYEGAIDDDRSVETAGKVNYVAKAVDELLAGSSVSTSQTKPYGCSVKF